MKLRWEQSLVTDMASGEPGLLWRKKEDLGGGRVSAFLFEVEDDNGDLAGIHHYSPGFDSPLDAAMSNKLEQGPITREPAPGIIARVDTGEGRIIEFVRNDPDDPSQEDAARQTRAFTEKIGDEPLEDVRRRAYQHALETYGNE